MALKGIIFDMDGTMVDNMMIHHRAWQQKLEEMGMKMSLNEVMQKVHGVNEEILERLFGNKFTAEQRKQYAWEKEEVYRKIYANQVTLIDGLGQFLELLRNNNIPLAIGSAAPPENVNFIIDRLKLQHYFEGIFHSAHVQKGKPDPEIYHLAAESMNLKANECIIFEDSVTGAEAAKRSGAKTVIVTTTHKKSEFAHFNNIIKFIADYKNLSLKDIEIS